MWDVVTIGEALLRLTPPDLQRLSQTRQLDVYVGGSECNVAAGLATLGAKSLWLSRLTDNPLGRLIEQELKKYGVDTSQVIWTNNDRVGLYFVEEGIKPRPNKTIYDRQKSSMSTIQPQELPLAVFQPQQAQLLHFSGISAALSPSVLSTLKLAQEHAQKAQWRISFDLNYRANLWDIPTALETCTPFLEQANFLFFPLRDARRMFYLPEKPELALPELHTRYPQATIILTLGQAGAALISPDGQLIQQAAFLAPERGRIGGGDAFVAGFLYGYLYEKSLEVALQYGVAAAAIKYTLKGDLPALEKGEIQQLIKADKLDWR